MTSDYTRKGAYYFQLAHHVHSMEKIREKFQVNAMEHDAIVMNLMSEQRRENLKGQGRLKLG